MNKETINPDNSGINFDYILENCKTIGDLQNLIGSVTR